MNKIDNIKEELMHLKEAMVHLEKAIDEYESIDWPTGIYVPHHIEIEMSQVQIELDSRIQEIEDKLERI
tara:strand:+ start:2664 stop:2870 length:207 start_codon:yes stop_codon:yes gene_type:complete